MSTDLDGRLRAAARDAHQVAGETDLHRRLESITGVRPRQRGRVTLAGVVAAAGVAAVMVVVLAQPRTPVPEISPGGPAPSEEVDSTPTTTEPEVDASDCSAAGRDPQPEPQPDLPAEVAELRDDIAARSVACNLDDLAALADPEQFTYSYGSDGDPAGYWRDVEQAGDESPPMAALRNVLDTPPGRTEAVSAGPSEYWWWPRLFVMDPAETPEGELEAAIDEVVAAGVHPRAMVEEMVYEFGHYIGYRVMIEVPDADPANPRWMAFVAGD